MCTILTVSKAFWDANTEACIQRLTTDAFSNSDGVSVLMLGDKQARDLQLSSMSMALILPVIKSWMAGAGALRLFVHQRMATTANVGVPFNHGFTDLNGCVIMHNGILHSARAQRQAVDSFALTDLPVNVEDAMLSLLQEKETYANVFRIWPNKSRYQVIRMSTGNLNADGFGNYSSNALAGISIPVRAYSDYEHKIAGRDGEQARWTPGPNYWQGVGGRGRQGWMSRYDGDDWEDDYWSPNPKRNPSQETRTDLQISQQLLSAANLDSGSTDADFIDEDELERRVSTAGFDEPESAADSWELEDGDELIAENESFFVIFNSNSNQMCLYSMVDGTLMHKEPSYLTSEELAGQETRDDLSWQARLMMDEMGAGDELPRGKKNAAK